MPPRKYVCYCIECRCGPRPYRLLNRAAFNLHQKAQRERTLWERSPSGVLQMFINSKLHEFQAYIQAEQPVGGLVFRSNVDIEVATTFEAILNPEEEVNQPLLQFERWYEQVLRTIPSFSCMGPDLEDQTSSLINRLRAHRSGVYTRALVQLENVRPASMVPVVIPDFVVSSIEAEISFAIRHFKFRDDLVFAELDEVVFGADSHLNAIHPANRSILEHLSWIDATSRDLSAGKFRAIGFQRQSELQMALKEQKSNIQSSIRALQAHKYQPGGQIVTIKLSRLTLHGAFTTLTLGR